MIAAHLSMQETMGTCGEYMARFCYGMFLDSDRLD